ncbi:MAG TPA: YeeE/YedE thiosulfate transporter family protein [Anaerolineae bacterium]|nr:YeeE/YedE thiosulfate transporter family protein [Anaerolineae bacterium]
MTIIAPIFIGFLFGFLLHKGGMTRYHKIVNVFRFTDMAVLKFMMSALVVGMIGIYLLTDLGLIPSMPITPTYIVGNLVGGLIFGVGMALAGVCAAPIAAGSGEGRLDYLIPGVLGMLSGALLFGLTYNQVYPALSQIANSGPVTLPQVIDASHWLVIGLFTVITLVLFYALERAIRMRVDKTKA